MNGMANGARSDSIDLLRFIAATAVVFVHIPIVGVGHFGVDIFFTISGFVMLLSTESFYEQFIIKRVIRILPMYYIFTFFVFLIALKYPDLLNNTKADFIHLFKSFLFIPFDKNGAGHYPILFLGWTLNFEMYFYLIFAIALKLNHKYRSVIATFMIVIVYLSTKNIKELPLSAFSSNIIFEFVLGMIIYELLIKINYRNAFIMVILLVGSLLIESDLEGRFFQLGLVSALFVYVGVYLLKGKVLPKYVTLLGGYSYALYLTHPYVIQFFDKITKWFSMSCFYQAVALGLSFVLVNIVAVFVYKFIEIPTTKFLRARLIKSK